MNNALIFAGGSGTRMNSKTRPKQFLKLYGKEIIIHTLENFQNHDDIDNIVVVCKEDWIDFLWTLLDKYKITKVKWVVPGGKTGQESIYNGLVELSKHCDKGSIVLVHDGVRPFINDELITNCINSVKEHGSAISVVPAIETIVSLEDKKIKSITDRSKCYNAKAPQCFYLNELLDNHNKAIKDGNLNMIDSASLMQYYGHDLWIVESDYNNIKITTPTDYYTAKALYEARENQQIFGL